MKITTEKLGLAAFIKINGGTLVQVNNREFEFESEISESEWNIKYANSSSSKFNAALIELNQIRRK